MAQRSVVCSDQALDLEIELGQTRHPELNVFLRNSIDQTNPSIHPVLSASGSTANVDPRHLPDLHDTNIFYGNHCDNLQHRHHLVPTLGAGGANPFAYNPYVIPSSTSSIFPMPPSHGSSDHVQSSSNRGVIGVGVDHYERNNFLDNIRGSSKKKNAEMVPRSHHHVNGSTSSSSSSQGVPPNSRPQQWDEPFEPGDIVVLDTVTFTPSEYRGSRVLSITEGSQRSVSRANAIGLHLDSSLSYHHNHALQGSYIGRSFQPSSNAWVEQFGNNGGDASSSSWNYAPPVPYLHGISHTGGLLEIGSMSGLGYQDTSSSSNSAIILHPSSMQYHHNCRPPLHMQGMRVVSYNFHPQLPGPSYRNPTNCNLHHGTIISFRDGLEYASRYQRPFPSDGDGIYRPHQRVSQSISYDLNGRMTLLSSEDIAVLEFPPGLYGFGNFIDQHRDMRLDIDDMSYEELLALEERIGDVNTGLSEETISICLRTILYASCKPSHPNQSSGMVQDINCIICQVEYQENEKIGILECGHDYHADCIKQWLLLKNICPICKATALPRGS